MATLTGERIEELKQQAIDHFWPHNNPAGNMGDDGIKLVQGGKGVWVEDVEGEQWFDTMAGMWLKNIGHGRKEVADAVYNQMLDISYTPGGTVSPATAELSGRIASLAPDKDARTYFVSGGSEAVETALKMAKQYHKNNGEPTRWKVISRRGSYHGATHACMSLGGGGVSAPIHFGPLMPGNIHIPNPDSYRNSGGDLQSARELEIAIQHEGPSTVAAFIGEPISAAAGIHVPHPEYWPTIREICDKYGVIMICDEVITGFGRTGKMFATEHWGVKPDIFTVAKALTSGYIPIGAGHRQQEGVGRLHGRGLHLPPSDNLRRQPCRMRRGNGEPRHHGRRGHGGELRRDGHIHVRAAADALRTPHRGRCARRHGLALRRRAGQGP